MAVTAAFSAGAGGSDKVYQAIQVRQALGALSAQSATALTPRSGVVAAGAAPLAVAPSSGMVLSVAAGQAMVAGWLVTVDAAETVTIPAAGVSARWDLVVLRVYNAEDGDATSSAAVEVVQGTTTSDPALPSARCLVLARVLVGASVSSINSGNITDRRTYTAAAGGMLRIPGALAASPSGLPPGQPVWDEQASAVGIVNDAGTGWDVKLEAQPSPYSPPQDDAAITAASGKSSAARAYLDGEIIHLKGWITKGSNFTAGGEDICTIPAGYRGRVSTLARYTALIRPADSTLAGDAGMVFLSYNPANGVLTCYPRTFGPNGTRIDLDGISWPA